MSYISDLQKAAYKTATEKGWWETNRSFLECMSLVHSELSEAVEEYRVHGLVSRRGEDGKPEGVGSELADAVIRIMDLSEHFGISLADEIRAKMEYNKKRPHRHGGKRA